jgi:hypothetical protein
LAGFRHANERFYSPSSIAKRLVRSPAQIWWTLPLNLTYGYRWWKTARIAAEPVPAGDLAVRCAQSG